MKFCQREEEAGAKEDPDVLQEKDPDRLGGALPGLKKKGFYLKIFKHPALILVSAPACVLHCLVEFGDHVDKSDVEEHPAGKAEDVDIGVELA